jgi:hypothetical protein
LRVSAERRTFNVITGIHNREAAMSKATGMLALVLIVGLVLPVYGQQQKGDIELQLQGTFSATIGADVSSNVGTIAGKFAPYITTNLQVGVGPTLTITTTTVPQQGTGNVATDTETKATIGTTAFIVYSLLLKDAVTVPYLGASYYKRDFSNGKDRGWVGANGGAKIFFAKKMAADLSMNYLFSLNPETKGGLLLFAVGLSFLL